MIFNTHLKPVFEKLLFGLHEAGIDYWVFGGVGISAYIGKFIRNNKDIDVFVREADFTKATAVLKNVCSLNNFELITHIPSDGGRPKNDIKIDGKELLSVMPVYLVGNIVEFRFGKVVDKYPVQILDKVKRNIDGNKFYTPRDEYIKQIFLNHLIARPDKLNRQSVKTDIEAVFTPEEIIKFKLSSSFSWLFFSHN